MRPTMGRGRRFRINDVAGADRVHVQGRRGQTGRHGKGDESLIRKIKKIGFPALTKIGCTRFLLRKICRRQLVPISTLQEYKQTGESTNRNDHSLSIDQLLTRSAPGSRRWNAWDRAIMAL